MRSNAGKSRSHTRMKVTHRRRRLRETPRGAYKVAVAAVAVLVLALAVGLSSAALRTSRHAPAGGTAELTGGAGSPALPGVTGTGREELNDDLVLGEACVVENVTAWPVYSKKPPDPMGDYLTLEQAQQQKTAEIREVGADAAGGQASGQVNQLVIENKGALPILVLAGTLVKGGKQDRQIAQDFIIPARSKTPVDAFCVEHGRWTANREGVNTAGRFQAEKALASKGVRGKAQFKASQSEVWSDVAKENAVAGKSPGTGTYLATVNDADPAAAARRERIRRALAESAVFAGLDRQGAPVGVAYAVDGKIREVRAFAHPKIFALHAETLINTVAMEGDLAQRKALAKGKAVFSGPAAIAQVRELVQGDKNLPEETVRTQGANENVYKKDSKVWSGKCKEGGKDITKNWTQSE